MGIRIGIGGLKLGSGNSSWSSYWFARLDTWIKGRSGLTLPATIGSDATILPACGMTNGSDSFIKAPLATKDLTFTNITMEVLVEFPTLPTAANHPILGRNASGPTAGDLSIMLDENRKIKLQNYDTAPANEIISDITVEANVVYHIIYKQTLGGNQELFVNEVSKGTIDYREIAASATEPFACGAWLVAATPSGFSNMNIYTCRIYNEALTSDELTQRWALKDVTRGLILAWDFMGDKGCTVEHDRSGQSNHGTWVGTVPYYNYSENGCQSNLDNGYRMYRKLGEFPIYLPKLIDSGSFPAGVTFPAGYTVFKDVLGKSNIHNIAGSKIRFPDGAVWDRSNTTTNNAQSRASDSYDVANVRDWHVWEVGNYTIITSYLNTDYQGTFISKVQNVADADGIKRPAYIDEILLSLTNLTGSDLTTFLSYTNND